jgi:uncharacterized membrane protein YcaP (DUF421 family)
MATIWTSLMTLGVPAEEKVLRAIAIYIFLVVGLRLSGKRELAQLNPFDFVVLLTLSNTVQNAIIGNDNSLLGGIIGASTLLAINYLTVRFMFTHPRIEGVVEGHPTTLIEHGKILEATVQRQLINSHTLKAAARRQGFDSLEEIERAVLEPSGTISFQRKEPTEETVRYQEVLARLDAITNELRGLRRGPA